MLSDGILLLYAVRHFPAGSDRRAQRSVPLMVKLVLQQQTSLSPLISWDSASTNWRPSFLRKLSLSLGAPAPAFASPSWHLYLSSAAPKANIVTLCRVAAACWAAPCSCTVLLLWGTKRPMCLPGHLHGEPNGWLEEEAVQQVALFPWSPRYPGQAPAAHKGCSLGSPWVRWSLLSLIFYMF